MSIAELRAWGADLPFLVAVLSIQCVATPWYSWGYHGLVEDPFE